MAKPRAERARELRHEAGDAERLVWRLLCDRKLVGCKFRRQHPIGPYFAEFACVEKKLVVEIDGEHHAFQIEADARRTEMMNNKGWRVVRFWANEIVSNIDGVWTEIDPPHPNPLPPRRRGRRGNLSMSRDV
jgi:very-short-patch-repair endonuclease